MNGKEKDLSYPFPETNFLPFWMYEQQKFVKSKREFNQKCLISCERKKEREKEIILP